MNAKQTLSSIALILLSAGNALAEAPSTVYDTFVSTRSREEVRAELFAFKKSGINPWSMRYDPLKNFKAETTREAVVAEYLGTRLEVKALNGEDGGSTYLARYGTFPFVAWAPGKSREEAAAELAYAIHSGDILVGGELALKRSQLYPAAPQDSFRSARRETFPPSL